MNTERPDPTWPEWVVRQGNACTFIQATTPEAAIATAARHIGPMGGWRVSRDVPHEVFSREEYREHAKLGDYTRTIIVAADEGQARPRRAR